MSELDISWGIGSLISTSQMGLLDLIDILVVAVVVYLGLRLMRGTRAEQMLIGLAVLFVIYELARSFGLLTVEWLFSQFFSVFIIIFVVLFQHEIRRGLMRVAVNPLAPSTQPIEGIVDVMVASAHTLVKQGWGGLIVIERETGLKHLMESGVKMEIALRSDVIQTLFCPKAPMHDGAVVVRYRREGAYIVAARVLLPLVHSDALQGGFGTRHRAAVGVSEESDALVMVISEERGEVHLAEEGKLSAALSFEQLRHELNKRLKSTSFQWGFPNA
ncbi:MAG: diadenylate cyclase [Mariprofundaceae bacterium]|nr:diadenylate cyclase [Mariprofundaceae bacterium]